jgi:hypothetical protein
MIAGVHSRCQAGACGMEDMTRQKVHGRESRVTICLLFMLRYTDDKSPRLMRGMNDFMRVFGHPTTGRRSTVWESRRGSFVMNGDCLAHWVELDLKGCASTSSLLALARVASRHGDVQVTAYQVEINDEISPTTRKTILVQQPKYRVTGCSYSSLLSYPPELSRPNDLGCIHRVVPEPVTQVSGRAFLLLRCRLFPMSVAPIQGPIRRRGLWSGTSAKRLQEGRQFPYNSPAGSART